MTSGVCVLLLPCTVQLLQFLPPPIVHKLLCYLSILASSTQIAPKSANTWLGPNSHLTRRQSSALLCIVSRKKFSNLQRGSLTSQFALCRLQHWFLHLAPCISVRRNTKNGLTARTSSSGREVASGLVDDYRL